MKKQSASKNFAILGSANILVKVLAVIYLPFQVHILGYYGNGVAATGYNVWMFLYSLSNAGLPNAISKMVSEQMTKGNFKAVRKILKCAYLVLLVLGILVALLMACGANFIAVKILGVKDAYLMLLTISPTLIFTSVSSALRGYFQGRQNMVPVAIANVIEQFLNSVFTVLFAWLLIKHGLKYGVAGTTIGTLIGAIGAAGFFCFMYFNVFGRQRKKEIERTAPDAPEISSREIYHEIAKYSLPAILSAIAISAAPLIDSMNCISRLQVGHYTLNSATSLFGVYSYQFLRLFTLAIAFSNTLVVTMIPSISEALALNNHALVKYRIRESYKGIYLIAIPSIAGITFLAQPLITLVFYKHNNGADLVMMGTWTAIFMIIMSVQSGALLAAGRPIIPSVNLIIGMAVKILLNYVLIPFPSINIKGAIIGTGAGYLTAVLLNQISMNKRFKFRIPFIRMMAKPALASVIMGVVCFLFYTGVFDLAQRLVHFNNRQAIYYLISDITVLVSAALGGMIYFTVMILIGGITKDDILRLPAGTKIYHAALRVQIFQRMLSDQK